MFGCLFEFLCFGCLMLSAGVLKKRILQVEVYVATWLQGIHGVQLTLCCTIVFGGKIKKVY